MAKEYVWSESECSAYPQSPLPLNVTRKRTASAQRTSLYFIFLSFAEIERELGAFLNQLLNHQNYLEKVQLSVHQWWDMTCNFTGR